ncbi:hypothetical protein [Pedococcus sp. 5OH_020]|uniref:hypothetical protein n=1 Tax=Pedococcus sp. 5OH_020 TaxID=2989814 RepID=UPI0022E9F783|nr:hypothetical protein [Pedococcus sp. 5OH_020]
MDHFRDSRPGLFYLNDDKFLQPAHPRSEVPPFLRFAAQHGVALDLWRDDGAPARELVSAARLDWPVMRREVIIPAGPGLATDTEARHYKALVRSDTQHVMSVVTNAYSVAENQWVAKATESFASRIERRAPMIAAVGFGREGERTLFAARVFSEGNRAVCLLAYNTHGGEGALRFQLVEVDRTTGVTYVLDSRQASLMFPHVGDVTDRLEQRSRPPGPNRETFVERYLAETQPLWERLSETLWTPRHTNALIRDLWGDTPDSRVGSSQLLVQGVDPVKARHPGHHLPSRMEGLSDASSAYHAICDWIDYHSEACERGDFTKDRDERLALGAGSKYKRDAWRWILSNT